MLKRLSRWLAFKAGRVSLPVALDQVDYLSDPHPVDDALRGTCPVAPVAGGGFVLTRHTDVRAAFTDSRLGNAPSRFAVLHPRNAGRHLAAAMATRLPPFLDMPAHRLPRQALVRAFHDTLKAGPVDLEALAGQIVADLPRGAPFDMIAAAAAPFACQSIAGFVGLPESDGLQRATGAFFQMFAPITDATAFAESSAHLATMRSTLADALARRRGHAPRDLLGHLLAVQATQPDLTDDHIIDAAFLVLADGVENIIAGSAMVLRRLLAEPDALSALRSGVEPDALVLEALRLTSPALSVPRIAREAFDLHGTRIEAEMPVFLHLAAAGRDPEVFTRPDRFVPGRAGAESLVFGLGRHRCIGEKLALAQIGTLVRALVRAGAQDCGQPFAFHPRFGHRWPERLEIILP